MTEITYTVPDMSCSHCEHAIKGELTTVSGVSDVTVDRKSKRVVVRGDELNDGALRAAIEAAGYEVA